jgi:hypothetical protein
MKFIFVDFLSVISLRHLNYSSLKLFKIFLINFEIKPQFLLPTLIQPYYMLYTFIFQALHGHIMNLLPLGYQLLRRNEFAEIISAHIADRKKTANLSQLT